MTFVLNMPVLEGDNTFPSIMMVMFTGPQAATISGQAMLNSYVRFVEAARAQYSFARSYAEDFANNNRGVYAFLDASSAMETCVLYMHRACQCMNAIRSKKFVSHVGGTLFSQRPDFMRGAVRNRLEKLRDAIMHSDEMVIKGKIKEGSNFMFGLARREIEGLGIEIYGVEIADIIVSFCDISAWLQDMSNGAHFISEFRPTASFPKQNDFSPGDN